MSVPRPAGFRSGLRAGVVLILVSAVVGLVLLLALLLAGLARAARLRSASVLAGVQVRQAASSGAEYAVARLAAEGRPLVSPGSYGRGDEWVFRDAVQARLAGARNPSYAHGEAWLDGSAVEDGIDNDADGEIDEAGEVDRIFVEGEAHRDLDGDGRFSAWSGRLRGGRNGLDRRFALRIECAEGKVPLNAGLVRVGSACADERDPNHASLAMVLNNLGVIAGVKTRRWDVPAGTGTDPLRACWIGSDLIRNRPIGGYRSWAAVKQALRTLPNAPPFEGAPYTEEDLEAIRPFVDLGPYETHVGVNRSLYGYAPISLWTASCEVLQAVWMHLTAASPLSISASAAEGTAMQWRRSNDLVGDPPPVAVRCPHSGAPFSADPGVPSPVLLILWPGEAEALAREMRLARQDLEVPFTWEAVRRRIQGRAPEIFADDAAALETADPAFRRSWLGLKASLAFQAVAMDPYPYRGCHDGLATWSGWGIDGDPSLSGAQVPPMVGFQGIYRILYPTRFDPASPPGWSPPGDPWPPYTADPSSSTRMINSQGFTLAAPVRFSVESRGWGASDPGADAHVEGQYCAAERLELTSQEDFEGVTLSPWRGGGRGILARELPAAPERHGCAPGALAGARIVSLPSANQRGFDGGPGFSQSFGALGLAPLEGGRQGAGLYWRMAEDFDGKQNDSAPPAWQEWWSEWDAGNTAAFNPAIPMFLPPYRFPSHVFGDGSTPETSGPYKASGLHGASGRVRTDVFDFPDDLQNVRAPWCTGMTIVSGTIPLASIEAWMGPESFFYIEGENSSSNLYLRSRRGWRPPARPGIVYQLKVHWGRPPGILVDTGAEWFVPDPDSPGSRTPLTHHAVLRFERRAEGPGLKAVKWTRFSLFVDGAHAGDHDHRAKHFAPDGRFLSEGGELSNIARYNLSWRSVAEVRLWNGDASAGAAARHAAGRYVRSGTFLSPLYSLDAPARLLDAQWTGVTPAAFAGGSGMPLNPFRVEVEGFADALGAVSLGRKPLGETPADVAVLSGLFGRPVRSFQYRVTLDATGLAGVLDETPLFESIWLRFQRRGVAPAWTAWESR